MMVACHRLHILKSTDVYSCLHTSMETTACINAKTHFCMNPVNCTCWPFDDRLNMSIEVDVTKIICHTKPGDVVVSGRATSAVKRAPSLLTI